jgi:hypothetical protein
MKIIYSPKQNTFIVTFYYPNGIFINNEWPLLEICPLQYIVYVYSWLQKNRNYQNKIDTFLQFYQSEKFFRPKKFVHPFPVISQKLGVV